jgi:hypothetical protein
VVHVIHQGKLVFERKKIVGIIGGEKMKKYSLYSVPSATMSLGLGRYAKRIDTKVSQFGNSLSTGFDVMMRSAYILRLHTML